MSHYEKFRRHFRERPDRLYARAIVHFFPKPEPNS